jgi:hypothetical protein
LWSHRHVRSVDEQQDGQRPPRPPPASVESREVLDREPLQRTKVKRILISKDKACRSRRADPRALERSKLTPSARVRSSKQPPAAPADT